jgi:hypothetical protein
VVKLVVTVGITLEMAVVMVEMMVKLLVEAQVGTLVMVALLAPPAPMLVVLEKAAVAEEAVQELIMGQLTAERVEALVY